ncbi:LysR family transcriptional regulator [Massilia sp. PAMC28688]|uniref:LysR family transcriptional regulator n=1 Tax=Massilia sp. PAMC28688 TaxID=2861283 RepID=UPI001C635787|nr:LysR family transcriptional regulator [Massilia sp. PAMC28688]QYF94107.1 LysR family transcriptional regulator [Massilia sp. PAMC28688]
MDRLQSMRVFAKVVEHGSFARAAQVLDMSNTVVTRNIADLEAHLGTRLLNRTTRKLSLTETGHNYLERVKQILADIDDADAMASSSARKASGTLRIYCQTSFGQSQLARLLPMYSELMPDVVLDVTLADYPVDLVEEGFDIGILLGLQKFEATMIARRLAMSKLVLCASPEYVARHGEPKTPYEVSNHKVLNFAFEQLRHSWPVSFDGQGPKGEIPISSRMVSNNGLVLRHAALAGLGIMVRSSFTLDDDFSSGRLVQLLKGHPLGTMPVNLIYPSRQLMSFKVRSFVDFMSAQFPHPESDPWLDSAPH